MSVTELPGIVAVLLKDGSMAQLSRTAVAEALLDTPEDRERKYDVLVQIAGKTVPVITLVRKALDGQDPLNTNTAEMALRVLGFLDVFARRRFDKETGVPLRFTREQLKGTTI
ncbi:hypothetical protein [Streptomyces subrutilus]|uniref:Uncharacterized protein n=1 Tax=Streptomyces subrutilus TaxID=36818 RepID=A0A1E5PXS1_9ACTN|nr:hypothetical protein [Streptomyces subrutilus]OEJ34172.1 hypothetical protein BGK67_25080 [Streptomyces subrutilus]